MGKSVGWNLLGAGVGVISGIVFYELVRWVLLSLLPQVPFLAFVLSGGAYADFAWFGIVVADIVGSMVICKYICGKASNGLQFGVLLLGVINIARYVYLFVTALNNVGYSGGLLGMYGTAWGLIVFAVWGGLRDWE